MPIKKPKPLNTMTILHESSTGGFDIAWSIVIKNPITYMINGQLKATSRNCVLLSSFFLFVRKEALACRRNFGGGIITSNSQPNNKNTKGVKISGVRKLPPAEFQK